MPRGENLDQVRGSREALAKRLGQQPYADGEGGIRVWARGSREALERFQRLTPEERGWVIEAGLQALNYR